MKYSIGDQIRVKTFNELKHNKKWLGWYRHARQIGDDPWPDLLGGIYTIKDIYWQVDEDDTPSHYLVSCKNPEGYFEDPQIFYEFEVESIYEKALELLDEV